MKKIIFMLLIISILSVTTAFGQNLKIQYDGKTVDYTAEPMTVNVNNRSIKMPLSPIVFNGRALVPAREVFEAIGATVGYNSEKKEITITNNTTNIKITINSNTAYVNNQQKKIPDGLTPKLINKVGEDAKTMVPIRFLSESLGMNVVYTDKTRNIAILTPDYTPTKLVVLDAGHGGEDSGALGMIDEKQIMEKDITLSVTKKVEKILKQNKVDVEMTRSTDVKPTLEERAVFANERNAFMFVSIHINANEKPEPYGIETYYCKSANSDSDGFSGKRLATDIQKNLISSLEGKDRGVKTANFYVIRETLMPAVLIELGFITNADEVKLLVDENYQDKAAHAIADAIIKNLDSEYTPVTTASVKTSSTTAAPEKTAAVPEKKATTQSEPKSDTKTKNGENQN